MQLQIKRLDPRAQIPTRATSGSAGMDLRALLDKPVCNRPAVAYLYIQALR